MPQKCSIFTVLEIFFKEPTTIHFIREISKKINLAQTSVRNNIKELEKSALIIKKKGKPFNGFAANRENDKFIHYKQAYNLFSLFQLKNILIENIHPKGIIVFGSYSRGEDTEDSDIDLLILSNIKKEIDFSKTEKQLKRKINAMTVSSIEELEKGVRKNILGGWVLYGEIYG